MADESTELHCDLMAYGQKVGKKHTRRIAKIFHRPKEPKGKPKGSNGGTRPTPHI